MDFLSPSENATFILAKDFNEQQNELVIKVSHQRSNELLFWYLDNTYLKSTQQYHEIGILPPEGKHQITVVDQIGNQITRNINIE